MSKRHDFNPNLGKLPALDVGNMTEEDAIIKVGQCNHCSHIGALTPTDTLQAHNLEEVTQDEDGNDQVTECPGAGTEDYELVQG